MKKRTKKLIILGSLCCILALLAVYFVFFFRTNRLLPTPGLSATPSYINAVYEPVETPLAVSVNEKESLVYLSDATKKQVHIFNIQGELISSFNKLDGKRKLLVPLYIGIDSKDNVYVADRVLASIFIFDKDGKFLKEYFPNNDKKYKWNPMGITFDDKDNMYVTDVGKHQVIVMDKESDITNKIGSMGYAPYMGQQKGKLYFPNEIAVSKTGEIYVADGNNNRIQIFDKNGKFEKVLLSVGAVKGFSLDEDYGKIYVVDVFGHTISAFNLAGKKLQSYGNQGKEVGQLTYPSDVAVTKDGTMYIADVGNNRFLIWKKPMEPTEAVKTIWPYLAVAIAAVIALIIATLTGYRLIASKKR